MIDINSNKLFLLEEIVKQNFASKYKGSILGIFWSFLKPLLIMILLTIIFSNIFSGSIKNYPVYVLSGKCIYDFFSAGVGASMISLKRNQNILKRTPAPKYIFIIGCVISEFINFLITLLILFGVMVVTNTPFTPLMALSFIPVFSIILMMLGIGMVLSILCIHYSDIEHLWSVVVLALMYSSAIFYPISIIPEPYYSYVLLNPFYWAIDQFRDFIYLGIFPNTLNMINLILLSIIVLIFGTIVFKKYEKKITKSL